MTEEEFALIEKAVTTAERATAECEKLRAENHRLRLALALHAYKAPRRRAGRPPMPKEQNQQRFRIVDAYKAHVQLGSGISLTDKEALIRVLESEYHSRGERYRRHGTKEKQELKTLQNKLSQYRRRLES